MRRPSFQLRLTSSEREIVRHVTKRQGISVSRWLENLLDVTRDHMDLQLEVVAFHRILLASDTFRPEAKVTICTSMHRGLYDSITLDRLGNLRGTAFCRALAVLHSRKQAGLPDLTIESEPKRPASCFSLTSSTAPTSDLAVALVSADSALDQAVRAAHTAYGRLTECLNRRIMVTHLLVGASAPSPRAHAGRERRLRGMRHRADLDVEQARTAHRQAKAAVRAARKHVNAMRIRYHQSISTSAPSN